MFKHGWDQQYGGIISFKDSCNDDAPITDWHKETGIMSNEKVWWSNAEALCATALANVGPTLF